MSQIDQADFELLLKAANYTAGPDAPYSAEARRAIDAIAKRVAIGAEYDAATVAGEVSVTDPVEAGKNLGRAKAELDRVALVLPK